MKIIETGKGIWVKDGERCKLRPSDGQTGAEMQAEAEAAGYVLSPLTPEERAKASLRPERDHLLNISDWTQLRDSPLSEDKIAAWAAYRQELRDLTDEIDENGEVDFPEKP
jgi:hypothetical protein